MEGFKVIHAVSPKNISDSWRAVTCNATEKSENCWWCCRNLGSTRPNTDTIRHPHHPHKISQAFFPLADWWLISSLQKWKPCKWRQTQHYRPIQAFIWFTRTPRTASETAEMPERVEGAHQTKTSLNEKAKLTVVVIEKRPPETDSQ